MGKLTDRKLRTTAAGTLYDGDGLQIAMTALGRGKWTFRYQLNKSRHDMSCGSYPAKGLAPVREEAADARRLLARGVDPIEARKKTAKSDAPVPTFADIAQLVIADAQAASTNEKVRYQWERHLGPDYCGALLSRPVNEITSLEVAAILKPVWHKKPEVARKLRPAIRRVFERARVVLRDAHDIVFATNPAEWADLKALGFEAPKTLSKGHHPSLSYDQTPAFIAELRERDAIAARALEFLILTNVRTDAVLRATWSEIDLEKALWIVPLERLKDRAHRDERFRVPLSPRAVELGREMLSVRSSPYIFPGYVAGKPFSNMALLTVIRRMNGIVETKSKAKKATPGQEPKPKWFDPESGRAIVPHGFRATFRTWAEETTSFPHAVVEQAMGHAVGSDTERAYRRTDVLERRRELMTAWASYCEPTAGGNVIDLARRA